MNTTLPRPAWPRRSSQTPLPAPRWNVRRKLLRVGFVRLMDAAPLAAAHELGLYAKYGVEVALVREIGWAAIRHRITFGEVEVAHAPCPLPLATTLGLGGQSSPCNVGLVMNLHGNAITLSKALREAGVQDGLSLASHVFSSRRREPLTFAVVSWYASHHFLLHHWLQRFGINSRRDVRLVVVPPEQMVRNLAAGHIDGCCAGEPWNSLAVTEAGGWCPALSCELDHGHPEKVLMAGASFAQQRTDEFVALTAAVLEACAWCDTSEGRAQLPGLLARREYLDLPAPLIARSLQGPFDRGDGTRVTEPNFVVFHRYNANEPTADKALWSLENLSQIETLPYAEKQLRDTAFEVFRADVYHAARKLVEKATPVPQTRT